MHSIRAAARRQAWTDERTPSFGLAARSPRRQDTEQSLQGRLQHVYTENALSSTPWRQQNPLRRAGTLPVRYSESITEPVSIMMEPLELDAMRRRRPRPQVVNTPATDVKRVKTWQNKVLDRFESQYPMPKPMQMVKALFGLDTLFPPRWNILLPFVVTGFAVYYTEQSPYTIFIINFIAMLPCSTLFYYGIEQVSIYAGPQLGALLSISSANTAQLITSIFLLKNRQIDILEASLLGTILQSLLLMTGLSFAVGGMYYQEQYFEKDIAQTICMLLLLAVLSLLVPTLAQVLGNASNVLMMSRGTAVVIMISYGLYLIFQIYTHRNLFEAHQLAGQAYHEQPHTASAIASIGAVAAAHGAAVDDSMLHPTPSEEDRLAAQRRAKPKHNVNALANAGLKMTAQTGIPLETDEELPGLSAPIAVLLVILATTLLTFTISFATDSLQGLMEESNLSNTFMGIVVLPLLGNDLNCIKTAKNNRMDMSIALTLERCMQTALMVIPPVVLIAWQMGIDEVSMEFNRFSVAALFAAVLIVCYVVQEGKANWLYGVLLIKVFIIVGMAAFWTD